MKSRILAPSQVQLAARICAVLGNAKPGDAMTAMVSIIAATINDRAADQDEALSDARYYADFLEETVRAGLRGELIRSDEAPIDLRFLL